MLVFPQKKRKINFALYAQFVLLVWHEGLWLLGSLRGRWGLGIEVLHIEGEWCCDGSVVPNVQHTPGSGAYFIVTAKVQ